MCVCIGIAARLPCKFVAANKFFREAILKTAKALVEDTKALVAGAASNQEQLAVAAQNAVRTIVNLSDAVKNGAVSEAILKTAKALVEDTKALVAGAASNQEQLAVAAQNAVRTIVNLSDAVKNGAVSLSSDNAEAQVMVIHAVRDVAAALSNLIQATKNASGRSLHDPAMGHLKEAAKVRPVMVTNVTSLLKTVKTVEDEHQRGTRALEAAIEAIGQEIHLYDTGEAPTRGS
ncbi:unnamed protein product [Gongylonema pulchrum]|uniref:I/LWEQ domain-containing protein n=1 Tax=Gongylonema pulchrum TaxID=637853 RepID=A0A183DZ39_9BILA|nr:unnamed protein product [Gongylonema pulchrum]